MDNMGMELMMLVINVNGMVFIVIIVDRCKRF